MKNINQINEYLSKSSWLLKFKRNVYLKNKIGNKGIQNLIKTYPREFINEAFTWSDTPEGGQYWCEVNRDYRIWLHSEE